MRKRSKRKNDLDASRNSFSPDQINILISSLNNDFLKRMVRNYVESAVILLRQSERVKNETDVSARLDDLRLSLDDYGKDARRLDLILSISWASGYLKADDKVTSQKVRELIEHNLDDHRKAVGDGLFVLNNSHSSLKVSTHSKIGRKIARLFSRVVPVTTPSDAQEGMVVPHAVPEKIKEKIINLLAAAKSNYAATRYSEAERAFKEILGMDRKNWEAHYYLGKIYLNSGYSAPAAQFLREANSIYPRNIDILNDLGMALTYDNKCVEAIEKFNEVLRLEKNNLDALAGLGIANLIEGNDAEALGQLKYAIKLSPNSAGVLARLGYYYQVHYEPEKAGMYYAKALKLAPNHPLVLASFGGLLCQQRKNDQGLALMDKALQIQPHSINYLCSKAYALLAQGNYSEGWNLYEHGLQSSVWRNVTLFSNKPVWKGETDHKKRLLILSEQGLGDIMHFIRYAALCKERVGTVHVLCPQTLVRLFKNCPYIDGVHKEIGQGEFDLQIAMMSLPHVFKTTLETVPAQVPYLYVQEGIKNEFCSLLGFASDDKRLKVGLVWSGSMFNQSLRGDLRAKRRNMDLKQLLPLFEFKEVVFCNLQMDDKAKQIDEFGLRDRFVDVMGGVKDMLDTAAIIENLDLVISVDTSVAHLAGALGKPVWIMSRYDADWRWLINRPDNPWYPTARVFGQPRSGDWDSVIRDVSNALKERIEVHSQKTAASLQD